MAQFRKEQTAEGCPYYVNWSTGETQWEHPFVTVCFQDLDVYNKVKNDSFRVALKVDHLRKKLGILHISTAASAYALYASLPVAHDGLAVRSPEDNVGPVRQDKLLRVADVKALLVNLYPSSSVVTPTDEWVETMQSCLLFLFDRDHRGLLDVRVLCIFFTLLSAGKLRDKYALLHLWLRCNYIVDRKGRALLRQTVLTMIKKLKEDITFPSYDDQSLMTEDAFIRWLLDSELRYMVWLPILHRIVASSKEEHDVRCVGCRAEPIVGLRYECRECFNLNLCFNCFVTGVECRKHKLTHLVDEHCRPTSRPSGLVSACKLVKRRVVQFKNRHLGGSSGHIEPGLGRKETVADLGFNSKVAADLIELTPVKRTAIELESAPVQRVLARHVSWSPDPASATDTALGLLMSEQCRRSRRPCRSMSTPGPVTQAGRARTTARQLTWSPAVTSSSSSSSASLPRHHRQRCPQDDDSEHDRKWRLTDSRQPPVDKYENGYGWSSTVMPPFGWSADDRDAVMQAEVASPAVRTSSQQSPDPYGWAPFAMPCQHDEPASAWLDYSSPNGCSRISTAGWTGDPCRWSTAYPDGAPHAQPSPIIAASHRPLDEPDGWLAGGQQQPSHEVSSSSGSDGSRAMSRAHGSRSNSMPCRGQPSYGWAPFVYGDNGGRSTASNTSGDMDGDAKGTCDGPLHSTRHSDELECEQGATAFRWGTSWERPPKPPRLNASSPMATLPLAAGASDDSGDRTVAETACTVAAVPWVMMEQVNTTAKSPQLLADDWSSPAYQSDNRAAAASCIGAGEDSRAKLACQSNGVGLVLGGSPAPSRQQQQQMATDDRRSAGCLAATSSRHGTGQRSGSFSDKALRQPAALPGNSNNSSGQASHSRRRAMTQQRIRHTNGRVSSIEVELQPTNSLRRQAAVEGTGTAYELWCSSTTSGTPPLTSVVNSRCGSTSMPSADKSLLWHRAEAGADDCGSSGPLLSAAGSEAEPPPRPPTRQRSLARKAAIARSLSSSAGWPEQPGGTTVGGRSPAATDGAAVNHSGAGFGIARSLSTGAAINLLKASFAPATGYGSAATAVPCHHSCSAGEELQVQQAAHQFDTRPPMLCTLGSQDTRSGCQMQGRNGSATTSDMARRDWLSNDPSSVHRPSSAATASSIGGGLVAAKVGKPTPTPARETACEPCDDSLPAVEGPAHSQQAGINVAEMAARAARERFRLGDPATDLLPLQRPTQPPPPPPPPCDPATDLRPLQRPTQRPPPPPPLPPPPPPPPPPQPSSHFLPPSSSRSLAPRTMAGMSEPRALYDVDDGSLARLSPPPDYADDASSCASSGDGVNARSSMLLRASAQSLPSLLLSDPLSWRFTSSRTVTSDEYLHMQSGSPPRSLFTPPSTERHRRPGDSCAPSDLTSWDSWLLQEQAANRTSSTSQWLSPPPRMSSSRSLARCCSDSTIYYSGLSLNCLGSSRGSSGADLDRRTASPDGSVTGGTADCDWGNDRDDSFNSSGIMFAGRHTASALAPIVKRLTDD